MMGHHLLSLYRSLTRHWLYAALNVLGLAVGIAVFLVLALLVRFETSYDRWLPNADNIYRISATITLPGRRPANSATSSGPILPALRADYPQVLDGVRLIDSERPVANGSILGSEHMDYVDPNFFDVLDLPVAAGDRRTALAHPDDAVVTEAVAMKYFATKAVVGRSVTLFYHGVPHRHRITAVLKDIPVNSHMKIAVLAPLTSQMMSDPDNGLTEWGPLIGYTYVRFRNPAEARAVEADLPRFVARRAHDPSPDGVPNIDKMLSLSMTPLPALHFVDARLSEPMKPGVDARLVYALGLVGALTLVIAILNYVNLATAQSALRAKEIALRKVLGATRTALVLQLLIEAIAFALFAALIGLALAELALPTVDALGGAPLKLAYLAADSVVPWVFGLAVAIGLGAGLYPALLLSGFEPALVLASARAPSGGRSEARVLPVLIGAQFAVVVIFTICTLVIGSQVQFIRDADRGFRRDGLILLDNLGAVLLAHRQNELLDIFRKVPGVVSATASWREPGLPNLSLIAVHRPGQKGPPVGIEQDLIADDYLKTFGAKLVAGRMFDRAHRLDDVAGPYDGASEAAARGVGVMLNVSAVRVLGFDSPARAIGQPVYTRAFAAETTNAASVPVIGVLRDVQFGSPQRPVAPVIYRYDSQPFVGDAVGAIRYAGVGDAEMMGRLEAVWRRLAPNVPFLGKTAEDQLSDFYVPDLQRARLFAIGSVLAVAIGCVGLYGLAAFNTARRFKEIGIRKTLGASTTDVLKLLLGQILRPVLIANLVAWPLAYFAMRAWLSSFDQRIALSPLFFIAASVLALAVAILTVVAQSLRLAQSEPARALRHE